MGSMKDMIGDELYQPSKQTDVLGNAVSIKDKARRSDPVTSHVALPSDINELQRKVLHCLFKIGSGTDLDVRAYCNDYFGERAESTYRHRRTDLVQLGLVQDTGRKLKQANRERVVWELSARGKHMVALLPAIVA